MSFVLWSIVALVGSLMLQPPALFLHAHKIKSEYVKDYWTEKGRKVDITLPRRINAFQNKSIHKRSIHSINITKDIIYSITAFNQTFIMYLTSKNDFIAPNIVLEYKRKNVTSETWQQSQNNQDCFYTGKVKGDPNSVVSISISNYMIGTIYAFSTYYIIQPHPSVRENASADGELPHVIYVTSDMKRKSKMYNASSTFCGTHIWDKGKMPKKHLDLTNPILQDLSDVPLENRKDRTKRASTVYQGNTEHHVELMVVADSKMAEFHGKDLQHYLFVLISIVASIYKSHTIENNINIVVVKVVILEDEQTGPIISSNAATTLHNFCQWQNAQNSVDDTITSHHDTAVLVTRTDICRSPMKCDTLGLAELGTICDPLRSCSIVEDNGLSTAFTIAHELGHVFSLPHDDDYRCTPYTRGQKQTFSLMAPTLDYTTNPWAWSTCSGAKMTEFLDAGNGKCLQDKPRRLQYLEIIQASQELQPGEIYNVDQQCKQAFGRSSRLCPYTHDMHELISVDDGRCKRLWCTSPGPYGEDQGCRTQHMPWADGTKCGPNMWCQEGRCLHRNSLEAVHGGWGSWEEYGTCSRTCGGGIKKSIRHCDNPAPVNGGKFCTGERVRFESCRTEKCQSTDTFRDEQCARHNGNNFNIISLHKNVRWIPKYKGIRKEDRCKLFCQADGNSAIYYRLEAKVKDGTKCDPDTTDVCVSGKCKASGCDNVMGSKKKYDKCGVCDGNDSTCHTETKAYNPETQNFGYNEVGVIPSGSSNILIQQNGYNGRKNDDNYLALKNERGEYVLNGNYIVSMVKKEVRVNGAVLEYSGSNNIIEVINGTRLIQEDISIMVLAVGKLYPPNITYRYTLSRERNTESSQSIPREKLKNEDKKISRRKYRHVYRWTRRNKECITPCGEGGRKVVLCVRIPDKYEVKERHCERLHKRKPKESSCSISHSKSKSQCDVVWRIVDESACTAHCGKGEGVQSREYKCLRSWPNTYRRTKTVDDKFCLIEKKKPPSNVKCRGICVEPHWKYGSWSKCTATCDGGIQHRHAKCIDRFEDIIPEEECKAEPRRISQICNKVSCPKWVATDWGKCSVTCGSGVRNRHVTCMLDDKAIPKLSCDSMNEQKTTADCNLGPCAQPYWKADKWSDCSVSCGTGFILRSVKCHSSEGLNIDDSLCKDTKKPSAIEACYPTPCTTPPQRTTQKTTGNPTTNKMDTKHSKFDSDDIVTTAITTKQEKQETTKFSTVNVNTPKSPVTPSTFGQSTEQENRESTTLPSATASWRTGSWTECSATCGKGRRGRYVSCRDRLGNMVPQASCLHVPKPVSQESCQIKACGEWKAEEWSPCPVTCGGGKKTREVVCMTLEEFDEQKHSPSHCDISAIPNIHEECNIHDCVTPKDFSIASIATNRVEKTTHWRTGPWGGGNLRTHKDYSFHIWHTYGICFSDGPFLHDYANAYWHNHAFLEKGNSGRTLVTHGYNVSTGLLKDSNNLIITPQSSEYFETEEDCSKTCGGGWKRRAVVCMDESGISRDCDPNSQPKDTELCQNDQCPIWRHGEWNQCSEPCGGGIQFRMVVCQIPKGRIINDDKCVVKKRPKGSQQCNTHSCSNGRPDRTTHSTAYWSKGPWTKNMGVLTNSSRLREVLTAHHHYDWDTEVSPQPPE